MDRRSFLKFAAVAPVAVPAIAQAAAASPLALGEFWPATFASGGVLRPATIGYVGEACSDAITPIKRWPDGALSVVAGEGARGSAPQGDPGVLAQMVAHDLF